MDIVTRQAIDRYVGMAFLVLVRPLVQLVGFLLRIDHSTQPRGEIVVVKMLGGGSLVIAFPALLGLRRAFPGLRLTLLTTPSVRPFAEALGLFDRIRVVDDRSFGRLLATSWGAVAACLRVDTVLNLEVYSKLTTVFSLLTLARNRIEFYLENVFWRRHVSTHLIFFNRFAGSYLFYDQAVRLMGAEPASMEQCRSHLDSLLSPHPEKTRGPRIAVGHGCSTFGRERMLEASWWVKFLRQRGLVPGTEIHFLGSAEEGRLAEEVMARGRESGLDLAWFNHCGEWPLSQSLRFLRGVDEFWGVDSSLHHFARLLGVPCVSFWGPTAPSTRLRPVPGLKETVLYRPLACSPCIHVAESPPCRGNNLCIRGLFEPVEENPTWVVTS